MGLSMQRLKTKDGIFKNGETGCSGQNREREMRCDSESLRNPSSPPGRSSSMTRFGENPMLKAMATEKSTRIARNLRSLAKADGLDPQHELFALADALDASAKRFFGQSPAPFGVRTAFYEAKKAASRAYARQLNGRKDTALRAGGAISG